MSKMAFITGASKRIGRAIAEHLAGKGWDVCIHFNSSEEEAENLEERLRLLYPGQKFYRLKANLEIEHELENLIPSVISKAGVFSLLVNNASVFDKNYLQDTNTEFLKHQMDVNFKAPFILIRDFVRHCGEGNIINMVDTRITSNKSNFAAYSISKKALWELTKMAALEFAPRIRVNAIAPGVSIPPEGKGEEYIKNLAAHIPAKEPVGLGPVLQSVDFILESKYLTGQLLFADGGENLGSNS
jgi:pteridine reductase